MATTIRSTIFDSDAARANLWAGEWRPARRTLAVREPATGETLLEVGEAEAEDVARASAEAAAAQSQWAARPAGERAAVMSRAAELLEAHHEEAEGWLVREAGSIRPKAALEVMQLVLGELRAAARLTEEPLEHELPDPTGRRSVMRRVPMGVVGVLAPWNFPMILAIRSVAPALALGNAVVLKADPHTPISGGFFLSSLLDAAGLPAGLLHVLPGGAEAGAAVCEVPEIGMVSFTGSTAVGRLVGEACGRNLKRVALELGGNNAFIVLEDADVAAASSAGAWGSFVHQGQICMTAGRHLVHERLAEAYLDALSDRARHLPIGDPNLQEVAIGPLIDPEHVARVDALVREARDHGAEVLAGGAADSPYYPPTVLGQVRPEMRAWREEIFGPVAPVMTFASDEEAIALANATEYGLSTGIYTADLERGRRIAEQVRTGLLHIGDQTVNDDPAAPFGGMGASGNGARFGGPANLEEFLQWQWRTERAEPATYPF
ncbi:MAG: aldehyde dehydrogenase family protein [Solirubrobacterales bacterium]|nr:aldehyde dehydrogenase family protein [Solirubrobacterales bacterium]